MKEVPFFARRKKYPRRRLRKNSTSTDIVNIQITEIVKRTDLPTFLAGLASVMASTEFNSITTKAMLKINTPIFSEENSRKIVNMEEV